MALIWLVWCHKNKHPLLYIECSVLDLLTFYVVNMSLKVMSSISVKYDVYDGLDGHKLCLQHDLKLLNMKDSNEVVQGSSMSIFIILLFAVPKAMDEIYHHSLRLTNVVHSSNNIVHLVLRIFERIFFFP